MNNSAMLRAFQILRKKPVVLLLILPIQAVSIISLAFMPDFSSILNMEFFADSSAYSSYMLSNTVFMLVNSLVSVISLVGTFLLLPPATELMADGAAGRETAPGWFTRGLKRHWWKPIVTSLISGAALTAVILCVYFFMAIATVVVLIPLLSAGNGTLEGGALVAVILIGVCFGLILAAISLVVQAFFALLLPAFADRSFGEAFKLLFSRKAFRQLPRLIGGYLLISFVSGLAVCLFGALYVLVLGVPEGPTGPVQVIMSFLGSGVGIFSMLLSAAIGVIMYPFQFAVYQKITDNSNL